MATITVCTGSSCFSRGNAMNAKSVQRFWADKGLTEKVTVKGCLCDDQCKNGQNLHINDKLFSHVLPAKGTGKI